MWYDIKAKVPDWTEATKFLAKTDPVMKELIKKKAVEDGHEPPIRSVQFSSFIIQ